MIPLLTFALGVIYATGFVIASASLAYWGVRDVDPVRPRHLATGFAFAAQLLLGSLLGGYLLTSAADLLDRKRSWNLWRRLAVSLGVLLSAGILAVLTGGALYLAVTFVGGTHETDDGLRAWVLWMFGALVSPLAVARLLLRKPALRVLLRATAAIGVTLTLLAATVWVLFFIPVYAAGVYPTIPLWLGGGEALPVRIVLDRDLPDCKGCAVRVLLVDEDANRLVVFVRGDGGEAYAVAIGRNSVRAVVYLP